MAVYGVQTIDDGSVINQSLVRCGPRINHDNSYGGFYEAELCAEGTDSNCREVILDNLGNNDECDDGCVMPQHAKAMGLTAKDCGISYLPMDSVPTPQAPMDVLGTKTRVAGVSFDTPMCVQGKATSISAICSMSQKILQ